jgi:hypothetical protein
LIYLGNRVLHRGCRQYSIKVCTAAVHNMGGLRWGRGDEWGRDELGGRGWERGVRGAEAEQYTATSSGN